MANFWTNNTIEPKRTYRWLGFVNLFGAADQTQDFGPAPFLVQSFTQPVMNFQTDSNINNWTSEQNIMVQHYMWEDGTVVFMDADDDNVNTTAKLYNWVKSLGYQPEQNVENLSELFTNLADQKLQLKLSKIDAAGTIFETWTFLNVVPTNINFGDTLDYSTDTALQVAMNFAYTTAKYEKGLGAS